MSNVSTIHDITAYVPKKSVALPGQRLAVIAWKTDSETGIKPDSVCVSVPRLVDEPAKLDALIAAVRPWIISQIEQIQNNLIRALSPVAGGSISQDAIDFPAIQAAILAAGSRSSVQFSDSQVREFFEDELQPSLMIAFAAKMGISPTAAPTPQQDAKIMNLSAAFRDSFISLAKTKIAPAPDKLSALQKALDIFDSAAASPAASEVAAFLQSRINKFSARATESDLLDAL